MLQDAVLPEGEEGFEDVLADGESYYEVLPGEEWPVEEACESLGCWLADSLKMKGGHRTWRKSILVLSLLKMDEGGMVG